MKHSGRRTFILGRRLMVSTILVHSVDPFIDKCSSVADDGRFFNGWAIRIMPWRLAIVIAWKSKDAAIPRHITLQRSGCGGETECQTND